MYHGMLSSLRAIAFVLSLLAFYPFLVEACIGPRCSVSAPTAPTNATVPSLSTTGDFTLSWTASSSMSFGSQYQIEESVNSGAFSPVQVVMKGTTSIGLFGKSSANYQYRVRACTYSDTQGMLCSSYATSNVVNVSLTPSVPAAPEVDDTSTSGEYSVTWSAVSNATFYRLYEKINGAEWNQLADVGGLSYNRTVSNGVYEYRLRACNSVSCSSYSPSDQITVNIDAGDLIPDAPLAAVNVPAQEAVGSIQGEAGNSGGAATYSIPIAVAPGRNGMQPSVSLNYSSRSGNGLLGQGWSLSAGGSISRCASIFDIDGYALSVQLNNNDRLCLNGERLKLFDSANYWANGATYHPESNPKVTVVKVSSETFEVRYPNGNVDFYGEGKRIVRNGIITSWMLSRKHDSSDNAIHYSYNNLGDEAQLYLTRIDYTGFQNSPGNRHVDFAYQTRQDVRVSYMAGTRATQSKRLKSITTRYGNQNISQYTINYRDDTYAYFQKLNYSTNEWTGSAASSSAENTSQTAERRSLLSDIKLCAWDENNTNSCLPRTVIQQNIWKAGLKAQSQVLPLADDRMFMGKLLTGDFDGDAKTDYGFARGSYLTSGIGM
ncbi:MAG: hypothetical protein HWE11_03435, partial [Gammaproteobacteria bacterium]|nr:hypothetical protein [Gammaproteobacteria bacterium]